MSRRHLVILKCPTSKDVSVFSQMENKGTLTRGTKTFQLPYECGIFTSNFSKYLLSLH